MDKPAVVTTTLEQVLSKSLSEGLDRVTAHTESVGLGLDQWILFIIGVIVASFIGILSLGVVYLSQTSQKVALEEHHESLSLNEVTVLPEIPNRAGILIELINGSDENVSALKALGYQVITSQKSSKLIQKGNILMIQPSIASASSFLKEDISRLFSLASSSSDLRDSTAAARLILGN